MPLLLLFYGHIIADFYLQPICLAEKKQKRFKFLLIHSLIYLALMSLVCFLFVEWKVSLCIVLVASVSHFAIDYLKILIKKGNEENKFGLWVFIVDQFLHIVILLFLYKIFNLNQCCTKLYSEVMALSGIKEAITYVFLLFVLCEPSSIFVKKIITSLPQRTKNDKKDCCTQSKKCENCDKNIENNDADKVDAGKLLGVLERIIVALFLLIGQYGSIGLVLTAKSIARFKQLEDKSFSEKYLVGTLTSLLIAFIATALVKKAL